MKTKTLTFFLTVFSFIAVSIVLLLTGCASLDKSPECQKARQEFSSRNLEIDRFRSPDRNGDDELKELKASNINQLMSFDLLLYARQFNALRGYAIKVCGDLKKSTRDAREIKNLENTLDQLAESEKQFSRAKDLVTRFAPIKSNPSFKLLMAHDKPSFKSLDKIEDFIKKVEVAMALDINRPLVQMTDVKYPSFSGKLKTDAEEFRLKFRQKWILEAYHDLEYMVLFNPMLQEKLSKEMPSPMLRKDARDMCAKMRENLHDFKIEEVSVLFWDVRLADGANETHDSCESALGVNNMDEFKVVNRSQLKDPFKRLKLTQFHLATAMTNRTQDDSTEQVTMVTSIDWPKFFKEHLFTKISELVEK